MVLKARDLFFIVMQLLTRSHGSAAAYSGADFHLTPRDGCVWLIMTVSSVARRVRVSCLLPPSNTSTRGSNILQISFSATDDTAGPENISGSPGPRVIYGLRGFALMRSHGGLRAPGERSYLPERGSRPSLHGGTRAASARRKLSNTQTT
jgi:hypothetical protein